MLQIPHYVMNFRKEFQKNVIDYFVNEYYHGRTPNPCIACNRFVKWESLLHRSMEIGADYIATGHYARIAQLKNGRYTIQNAAYSAKDQTYALYNLTQEQLMRTLMPAGDYSKEEIRSIAKKNGLLVADKPDSQEICFVPDGDYAGFLEEYSGQPSRPGNFVLSDGTIVGQHRGIIHYTVGQRKGLQLSLGHPVFVLEIRPDTNEVVIGENHETFTTKVYAKNLNFMARKTWENGMRCTGKIRYNHKGSPCQIYLLEPDLVCAEFDEPVRAVTPGQALVLYEGEYCLGGGIIIPDPL